MKINSEFAGSGRVSKVSRTWSMTILSAMRSSCLVDRTGQWYDPEGELKPLTFVHAHLFVKPVVDGKDVLGWFILNFEPEVMDISANLALDQAAVAAALEISRQAAIRQIEWRLQAKFLDNLISM